MSIMACRAMTHPESSNLREPFDVAGRFSGCGVTRTMKSLWPQ